MFAISVGAKGTSTLLVGPRHLADQFKDPILPPVFATPMLVLLMENAALHAIRDFLKPRETAVGTEVSVQPIAAPARRPRSSPWKVGASVSG